MSIPDVGAGVLPPRPYSPPEPTHFESRRRYGPRCLHCGLDSANRIYVPGTNVPLSAFCTVICASNWALVRVLDSQIVFCETCQEWTDLDGVCAVCDEVRFTLVAGAPQAGGKGGAS